MLTLISGTNRKNSNTRKVAQYYLDILIEKKVDTKYFLLEDLPHDFVSPDMYDVKNKKFIRLQEELFYPAKKFIFMIPEYIGSYPGILKLMLDVCEAHACFYGKKACLVGIADGRAGNLRGLDQLTSILNHLKVNVLHNKVKISGLDKELDTNGKLISHKTIESIHKQIDEFLAF